MLADGTDGATAPPVPPKLNLFAMPINSCKSTKRINSFQYVAIPSPRDVFSRYGERLSSRGEYSTSGTDYTSPALVNPSSTIDAMINAQRMLEKETASGSLN